jgi:hypothetical protein
VLAEVFLDHVSTRIGPPSRTRQTLAFLGKPRNLVGAAILGLSLLGVASVQPFHQAVHVSGNVQAQPIFKSGGPAKIRVFKSGSPAKIPGIPLAPKAPAAPQAPAPKSGS